MWSREKSQKAIQIIRAHGRPHGSFLLKGVLGTVGVVLFRLALPWPLRGVVELVFPGGSSGAGLPVMDLPVRGDPVLWLGGVYLLLALGVGIFELIQRVNIMRFAALTVHDLRAAAVRSAVSLPRQEPGASGDLVARIVGDSARIKAGLSGILVHVLQNGLMFLGICAVLFWLCPKLGLLFLAAGLMAVLVGMRASLRVAENTRKQRRKEGDYAVAIQEGLASGGLGLGTDEVNQDSARKDVGTTKMIALSTLTIHVLVALAVGLGLWVGATEVRAGNLAPGDLFLFIAYALTMHRRMVHVGRQFARSGKVLASTNRIAALLEASGTDLAPPAGTPEPVPLTAGLRLERVKLLSSRRRDDAPRLRSTDLDIPAGSRVAVLGDVGAGKSALLQLLAGRVSPDRGKLYWDDEEMISGSDGNLASRVAYLPQDPVFPRMRVWKLLGLRDAGNLTPTAERVLRRIGAWKWISRLPRGLGEKLSSLQLTRNQSRELLLGGILLSGQLSVWVLDDPLLGLERHGARRRLGAILDAAGERTVILALSQAVRPGRFDRVLQLRRGKIRFDGTPAEWKQHRLDAAASRHGEVESIPK